MEPFDDGIELDSIGYTLALMLVVNTMESPAGMPDEVRKQYGAPPRIDERALIQNEINKSCAAHSKEMFTARLAFWRITIRPRNSTKKAGQTTLTKNPMIVESAEYGSK